MYTYTHINIHMYTQNIHTHRYSCMQIKSTYYICTYRKHTYINTDMYIHKKYTCTT